MTLEQDLENFYGSEQFFRNRLFNFIYTEGVQHFAEKGGAYWALTDIMAYSVEQFSKSYFLSVTLTAKNGKADLVIDDGNNNVLKKKHYGFTDLENGTYKFYCIDDGVRRTMLLRTEY